MIVLSPLIGGMSGSDCSLKSGVETEMSASFQAHDFFTERQDSITG